MSAVLKVLEPGLQTTIQDFGRPGLLRHGVPRSGAVDRVRLQLGNALVGNSPGEAALEVRMIGPTLQAEGGPVRLGLAGEMTAEILRSDGDLVSLVPWQSLLLQPGDQLRKVRLTGGCTGYLCVAGGLDLSPVLGSVASYRYARLGGLGDGAALTGGAVLALRQSPDPSAQDKCLTAPLEEKASQLRVIFGPQDQHFAPDTLARFAQEPFLVSHQADRMGVRLVGQAVHPLPGAAGSMRSDGSVPGAIQVPGSGEPVILGADSQTIGGYPKIATVIAADLHKVGQLRPGDQIRFHPVSLAEAQRQRQILDDKISRAVASITPFLGLGAVDLMALYASNIIGGMVDAQRPNHFPENLEDPS